MKIYFQLIKSQKILIRKVEFNIQLMKLFRMKTGNFYIVQEIFWD